MTFQGHAIEGELKTLLDSPSLAGGAQRRAGERGRSGARHEPRQERGTSAPARSSGRGAARVPVGLPCLRPGPSRADVAMLADICAPEPPCADDGSNSRLLCAGRFRRRRARNRAFAATARQGRPDRLQPGQYPGRNAAAVNLVRTDQGRRRALATKRRPSRGNLRGHHRPYRPLGRRHARLARGAAVARRGSSSASAVSWSSRVAGRWPGTRRRGRKIFSARPSLCCGRRPLRGDRCSVWQSFRQPIGSRWPMFPNRVPARTFACRRWPARSIPAMRKRSTARWTTGSRTSRKPSPGRRPWFPMPVGSIRADWPPMSSAA